jgi:two-component sensor histidine kinase
VRGLRRDAARLGQGESVAAKSYPVTEIAEVSQALALASEQRQAAERQVHFLMRELAHRSKNQMTVISAMAKQTARGAEDVTSYVQSFEKRIMGLARSTDLLLAHGVAGVSLMDLVSHQVAPFSPPTGNRVTITGPMVRLNAQSAQILGMAVHELSTNAVKYGAFSGDAGVLEVDWILDGTDLNFTWRETVPSLPLGSGRTGFGTTVLQSMVAGSLGAEVGRLAHADGIEWRFTIPRDAIDPAAAAHPLEPDADE